MIDDKNNKYLRIFMQFFAVVANKHFVKIFTPPVMQPTRNFRELARDF